MTRRAAAVLAAAAVALLGAGPAHAEPQLPCLVMSLDTAGVSPRNICVLN